MLTIISNGNKLILMLLIINTGKNIAMPNKIIVNKNKFLIILKYA